MTDKLKKAVELIKMLRDYIEDVSTGFLVAHYNSLDIQEQADADLEVIDNFLAKDKDND